MDKDSGDPHDHSLKVAAQDDAQEEDDNNEKQQWAAAPKKEEQQEEQGAESGDDDSSSSSGAEEIEEDEHDFRSDGAPHEISVPSSITTSQATTGRSSRGSRKRRHQEEEDPSRVSCQEAGSSSIVAGGPMPGMRSAVSNAPYRVVAQSSTVCSSRRRPTTTSDADIRLANRLTASAARRHNRKQRREQERRRLEQDHQRHFARQVSQQLLELERTFNEARQQLVVVREGEQQQSNGNDSPGAPGCDSQLPPVPLPVIPTGVRSGYEADEETASSGDTEASGLLQAGPTRADSDNKSEHEQKKKAGA